MNNHEFEKSVTVPAPSTDEGANEAAIKQPWQRPTVTFVPMVATSKAGSTGDGGLGDVMF